MMEMGDVMNDNQDDGSKISTESKSDLAIGVISILPRIENPAQGGFEKLYSAIGLNTGNLMFTNAMYQNISGNIQQVDFSFNPAIVNEKYDVVIIPAANWLNEYAEWDFLTNTIDQLDVPVVVIGIGLQANTLNLSDVKVSESAQRFIKAVSKKSNLISTRGDFTTSWLQSIGIENVVTTGCPSLYMDMQVNGATPSSENIVLQSTRYGMSQKFLESDSMNRNIFNVAGKFNLDMIYQSEKEEMEFLLTGGGDQNEESASFKLLPSLYGFEDGARFAEYLRTKGHVFYDLDKWRDFIINCRGVIGTRLHGAILSLNSGVPAFLIGHDSRTAELINFAAIPSLDTSLLFKAESIAEIEKLFESCDVEKYRETRLNNFRIYRNFLLENKLGFKKGVEYV
jgi:polysaccharide pyruvyl transferase WcaK-like protein